jgi:glucose-1-phosphate cytidylyltransferase
VLDAIALQRMTVVILCGGKGTRAYPHTADTPKPLIEVEDRPILGHVMDIYASQGCRHFVLAVGYKAEMIEAFAEETPSEWDVVVSNAGEEAGTAERILACRHLVNDPFFATYGDGVGDVDLEALAAFHGGHAGCATLTTVPLRSQYGTVDSAPDGRVERFREKPVLDGHWINGGFFVFDRSVFDLWRGRDLEGETLPHLAGMGQLYCFRHQGFWRSLDTYKDALELTALALGEPPPWTVRRTPNGQDCD